jgi:chromosome segregation protein
VLGMRLGTRMHIALFMLAGSWACRLLRLPTIMIWPSLATFGVPPKTKPTTNGQPIPPAERLVIFPGMELTLGVPCQALLIFDADFLDDMFSLAMTALIIEPSPDINAKAAAVQRLDHVQSLKQLKDGIDKHKYLRGCYIILPNVGEGKFSLLRTGQAGKFIEMPCVGGYVDGRLDKLGQGNRDIISGKAKEWGNKRIACLQTSDNRREDHEDLGTSRTWVKWAVPTAEALRQACLAQESRISQDPPALPSVAIESISINNSIFLGPMDLWFNQQYNCLIGGRGTGKSTVLEYVRWALCDQPPGLLEDDAPNYQRRRIRLIEQTLKPLKASAEIRFEVNGVPHIVRRSGEDGSLQLRIGSDEMRPCSEEDVRALLPIQAYSQKQLSDVSVRIEELLRFITAPIRTDLSRIDRSLADGAEHIRQTYAVRQRQRALKKQLKERALEETSLQEQANTLRRSLTGLSEDDRILLDRGPLFDAADQTIEGWLAAIRTLAENAATLRDTAGRQLKDAEQSPGEPEGEVLQAAFDEQQAFFEEAKDSLDVLITKAEAILAQSENPNADSPWGRWAIKLAAFRQDYTAAVQRSSVHAGKMAQLKAVEEKLIGYRKETARLREALKTLGKAEESYAQARQTWHELLAQRADLIDEQCLKLTESAGGAIRAQVRRHADATEFLERLREAISGSGVRRDKIEQFGKAILESDSPRERWEALLNDMELLAEHDSDRDGSEQPLAPNLIAAGLTPGELQRVARSLKPETWLNLSLAPIKSVPQFEYRARENEYIPFSNASAGQQATALLKTLLNHAGPPLIVDQPEEDLDNPVILEIVEQIWRAKQMRQIIFASHNANLVVNGDAELVVWFDHRRSGDQSRGRIAGEGAIDVPETREAIKKIMEGGEAAFNLRKEKYGF